ncbi:MAG: hypothetical protein K2L67_00035 [Clostridia bacterium]|nr:hypothetical protein [Clostridia bacterium]
MKKRFIKIICGAVATVCTFGALFAAGCAKTVKLDGIDFTPEFEKIQAESNGGFAVKKDKHVYFINGVQSNTADNTYGTPEKGAIYRISESNLSEHNYAAVDCVVPNVAYNFDYNTGLFIYGNYIYFATPSVNKDSEGKVYSDVLELKRAKLDGTEVSGAYIQLPKRDSDKKYQYRFVQENVGDPVYVLYVSTDEKLEGTETATKNLRSLNLETGVDTVLASNVDNVIFDEKDKSNPRVFYTMNVKNYSAGSNYSYNQVYTVTASATEDKFKDKLSSENIIGWDDENDLYINCGDLVFDGIGYMNEVTPFNYAYGKEDVEQQAHRSPCTYALVKYQDGVLFYTGKTSSVSKSSLYELKESAIGADEKTPLTLNADKKPLLKDGGSASGYTYIVNENSELEKVLYAETAGISVNKVVDGELQTDLTGMSETANYYKVVQEGTCTILFTDNVDNRNYLYYSVSGDSGYTFYRIDYTGNCLEYAGMPGANDDDGTDDYTPVKILDLVSVSDWYKPELIGTHLLYANLGDSDYYAANYITAFDLRAYDAENKTYGAVMTNKQLEALNEEYEEITEIFGKPEEDDSETYAHLTDAYKYLFRNGDINYVKELAAALNAELEKDEKPVYSDKTLEKLTAYLAPSANNEWSAYLATKKVNGADVKANTREYYYATLGKVTNADAEELQSGLKNKLLQAPPAEKGWYESLSDGAKAGFIVGMCALGLAVIGGVVALTVILVKRKRKAQPERREKRIKVDTYDDKNIDVYGTDEPAPEAEETTKE